VAGVIERRWWPEEVSYADAAALAGERAIEAAGIDRSEIGLLVDTSVCRAHLEPSAAVDVHRQLSLASSCLNFDLANACLGFVNAMHLAATMIDGGQIRYALIVDGEGSRTLQEATLARLARRRPRSPTCSPSSPRSPWDPAAPRWCWDRPTPTRRVTA
jgi:acyl-CoA:acyl-CoA alkyltransferase